MNRQRYLSANHCNITKTDSKHTSYTSVTKLTTSEYVSLLGTKVWHLKCLTSHLQVFISSDFRHLKVKSQSYTWLDYCTDNWQSSPHKTKSKDESVLGKCSFSIRKVPPAFTFKRPDLTTTCYIVRCRMTQRWYTLQTEHCWDTEWHRGDTHCRENTAEILNDTEVIHTADRTLLRYWMTQRWYTLQTEHCWDTAPLLNPSCASCPLLTVAARHFSGISCQQNVNFLINHEYQSRQLQLHHAKYRIFSVSYTHLTLPTKRIV